VAGGYLYTMSVQICTLYAGGCLRSISSVSPWYPLVGIPVGVHSPHSARLGHPSRLKLVRWRDPCRLSTATRKYSRWIYWLRADSHFARVLRSSPSQWLMANRCVVTKTCRKKAKLVASIFLLEIYVRYHKLAIGPWPFRHSRGWFKPHRSCHLSLS